MGTPRPRSKSPADHAEVVSEGLLDCAGASVPVLLHGRFNFSTFGCFGNAEFVLQRSFNGRESFISFEPQKKIEWNRSYILNEPERGVWWQLRAIRLFHGVIRYRFSQ
jgi:hypothetical protein